MERKAVVVSRNGPELQVLHPENYSTVEIRLPPDIEPPGEEITVIQWEEVLYPVLD